MSTPKIDPRRTVAQIPTRRGWRTRWSRLWQHDREGVAVDVLRVGMGSVWALNLIFIAAPANEFFSTFREASLSFAPTSVGGPTVADFVAAHALVFAWITVLLTSYLATSFLLGLTTRLACIVGGVASIVFLVTQFLSTFTLPGATDVGPHPVYLLIYLLLFAGGAGRYLAADTWVWGHGRARFPRLTRLLCAPRP